jgi:nicotinamide-nucleotide amidase
MADRQLEEWLSILQQIIGDLIYGFEDDALEQMVAVALRNQHKILALAESCTGGAIAQRITSVPGSSAFFRGGVVAYSNSIKEQVLGVDPKLIQTYGAVSEEVAKAMAQGALKLMQADVAVAVTGIAGPEGGTDQKPVGTVFIAFADQQQCFAQQFQFGNERLRNIEWTVQSALSMLRKQLLTING